MQADDGFGGTGSASLTIAQGFTNAGAIELTNAGTAAYSAALTVSAGVLTNTGSITTLGGTTPGGGRTLTAQLDNIGIERADGLLTGRQAKIATDRILDKLAAIEARQHDQERLRVFDGLPLGQPEVVDATTAVLLGHVEPDESVFACG